MNAARAALDRDARSAYRPFPNVPGRNAVQRRLEIPALVRLLALPAGGELLEVGCGRGVALAPLARLLRPSAVAGVDVDGELVREADGAVRAAGLSASLHAADVRALPFADESFDLVVDFGTCYHVAGADRALAEIARVLRPDGLFVHETPLAQALAHPTRCTGKSLPWHAAPSLRPRKSALLWASRVKDAAY